MNNTFKRIRNILIFLLLLSVVTFLESSTFYASDAQTTEEKRVVQSISVFGNVKSSKRMIKRVILLKVGKRYSGNDVTGSRERLEKLGIFELVDIETIDGEKGLIVIVNVQEKKNFFMAFEGTFNDNDSTDLQFFEESEKNYLGINFGFRDFTGKQQTFRLNAGIGNIYKLGLLYRKENFSRLSWGAEVETLKYKSALFETDIEKFMGRMFVAKQLNRFFLRLWGGYDHIDTDEDFEFNSETVDSFRVGADMIYNSKNLDRFPSRGIVAGLGGYKVFDTDGNDIYDRYKLKLAAFLKVFKKSVIAVDFQAILSDGIVPFNEKIYFGGYRTLRGVPVGRFLGDQALLMSWEYRIPVGIISRSQGRSRFLGASVYLFADFGLLADKVKEFDFNNLEYNAGIGLNWALIQDFNVRFDLSVYPKFRFTIGTGWKF